MISRGDDTTAEKTTPTIAALATILGCRAAHVPARLRALDLIVVPCSRCGGSGRYSWNQTDGDRCFGCAGFRVAMPRKVTPAQIEEVRAAVAAGKLASYLHEISLRAQAKKIAASLMGAWNATYVARLYAKHWMGSQERAPDLYRRNSLMCDRYEMADRAARVLAVQNLDAANLAIVHAELATALAEITALDYTEEEAEKQRALCVAADKVAKIALLEDCVTYYTTGEGATFASAAEKAKNYTDRLNAEKDGAA